MISLVKNGKRTCMLCVWLGHQIIVSVATSTGPKLIMKNDLPPACILGKALTINCKSTFAWPKYTWKVIAAEMGDGPSTLQ